MDTDDVTATLTVVPDRNALAKMRGHTITSFVRAREECIGEARSKAPVSVTRGIGLNSGGVQGGLRASITDDGPPHVTETQITGKFGSGLRYAMQREKGGPIVPVRKLAISWVDPATGIRFVVGPTIKRTHAEIDKVTGLKVIFVKKAGVVQRPGGPRQGYQSFIGPAGDKFPGFFSDHLRSGGW